MLRCRNKREKVEKCGRVPVFPQPLLKINHLQNSGAESGAETKKTSFLGRFLVSFRCVSQRA